MTCISLQTLECAQTLDPRPSTLDPHTVGVQHAQDKTNEDREMAAAMDEVALLPSSRTSTWSKQRGGKGFGFVGCRIWGYLRRAWSYMSCCCMLASLSARRKLASLCDCGMPPCAAIVRSTSFISSLHLS
jgi:hypothetical protein